MFAQNNWGDILHDEEILFILIYSLVWLLSLTSRRNKVQSDKTSGRYYSQHFTTFNPYHLAALDPSDLEHGQM